MLTQAQGTRAAGQGVVRTQPKPQGKHSQAFLGPPLSRAGEDRAGQHLAEPLGNFWAASGGRRELPASPWYLAWAE